MARELSTPAVDASLHAVGGVEHGRVARGSLVRLLLALKWTLWKRSFRKNTGKIIGTVFGVLYGIGGLAMLATVLGGAALLVDGAGPEWFGLLIRGLGAALVLVWLLAPLLAFGLDDTLDPRRFAALPRSARELQPGLFAAAALSFPSLFTLVGVIIATVCEVLWLLTSDVPSGSGRIAALVLVLPANLLGYALCLLLPRAVLAQSATRQTSRRRRELGAVIALPLLLAGIYGYSLAIQALGAGGFAVAAEYLRRAVAVAAWTPFGAPFAVVVDAAEGLWVQAVARLLIAVASVVLVWLWWRRSIRLALRSALLGEASSGTTKVTSLVPRWAPSNALGAAIGRSLRYWRRDSRYAAGLAVMPVMIIFFVGMGLLDESQRYMACGGVVFVTALTGISLANEIGFDGPAGWVNITSGMPTRANLWGRVIALAVITVPVAILASVLVPLLIGLAPAIPLVLLGALGASMSAWGVSLLAAVLVPYPSAAPGTNPLKDRSSASAAAMIGVFGTMLGMWLPQIPAIVLAIIAAVSGSMTLALVAAGLALLVGALTLWLAVRGAARILDRAYVDRFQKVRAHV
ncbi:hypothetical protein [Brachybacterium huguangmaarense]